MCKISVSADVRQSIEDSLVIASRKVRKKVKGIDFTFHPPKNKNQKSVDLDISFLEKGPVPMKGDLECATIEGALKAIASKIEENRLVPNFQSTDILQ